MILQGDKTLAEVIASQEISTDRNFWLPNVAGHERKKFGQFRILIRRLPELISADKISCQ